jgi:hypothetical protein
MRSGFLDLTTFGACKAYVAKYMSSAAPTTFAELRNSSRAGTVENYFAVGDQFVVPHSTLGDLTFDLIGIGQDTPADAAYATNFPSGKPLTLQLHDCLAARQFNGTQCNYKIIDTIAEGAWCIKLQHPDVADGVDTYYDFTVPAGGYAIGGMLRITAANNVNYYAPTNKTLASPTSNAALTAGEVNTKLGVSPAGGAQLSAQNDSSRVKSGSNRWAYSSVRQWLNSSAAAGAWWAQYSGDYYSLAPSTPTYATDPGFLNGMDTDFLAVVGSVTKRTVLAVADGATINAADVDIGANDYEDTTERFFLPSRYEMNGTKENRVIGNTIYSYYSAAGAESASVQTPRIKYRSGAAVTWMARGAVPSASAAESSTLRLVSATGNIANTLTANYNLAGVVPACVIW